MLASREIRSTTSPRISGPRDACRDSDNVEPSLHEHNLAFARIRSQRGHRQSCRALPAHGCILNDRCSPHHARRGNRGTEGTRRDNTTEPAAASSCKQAQATHALHCAESLHKRCTLSRTCRPHNADETRPQAMRALRHLGRRERAEFTERRSRAIRPGFPQSPHSMPETSYGSVRLVALQFCICSGERLSTPDMQQQA